MASCLKSFSCSKHFARFRCACNKIFLCLQPLNLLRSEIFFTDNLFASKNFSILRKYVVCVSRRSPILIIVSSFFLFRLVLRRVEMREKASLKRDLVRNYWIFVRTVGLVLKGLVENVWSCFSLGILFWYSKWLWTAKELFLWMFNLLYISSGESVFVEIIELQLICLKKYS